MSDEIKCSVLMKWRGITLSLFYSKLLWNRYFVNNSSGKKALHRIKSRNRRIRGISESHSTPYNDFLFDLIGFKSYLLVISVFSMLSFSINVLKWCESSLVSIQELRKVKLVPRMGTLMKKLFSVIIIQINFIWTPLLSCESFTIKHRRW